MHVLKAYVINYKKIKPNVSFEDGKKALIIANSATESVKYNKLVKLKI